MKLFWERLRRKLFSRRMAVLMLTTLGSLLYLWTAGRYANSNLPVFERIYQDDCERAQVVGILARRSAVQQVDGVSYGRGVNITFAAQLQSGPNKGDMITVVQNVDPDSPYQMREVKTGDKVLVIIDPSITDSRAWILGEYVRTDTLLLLAGVLCVLMLLFGQFNGFCTVLSLVFTCVAVFCTFVPAILSGRNIYVWTMLTCGFIIVMTLLLVNGANRKSLCGGIGCLGGVLCAGAVTTLADAMLRLTGMVDEESLYLKFLLEEQTIDLNAIIFAGILIGAVGAIMDVAISMASALYELASKLERPTFAGLLKSGFTIGRDVLGTMSNTLVLAYIGGSLSTTLLLMAYSGSLLALLNREMIVVEILQAIVGSFGLLFTIPLTSLACALLYSGRERAGAEK